MIKKCFGVNLLGDYWNIAYLEIYIYIDVESRILIGLHYILIYLPSRLHSLCTEFYLSATLFVYVAC